MNVVREVWNFIAGGSIVAPIGLAIAIIVVLLPLPLDTTARSIIFLALVFATFIGATFERPA